MNERLHEGGESRKETGRKEETMKRRKEIEGGRKEGRKRGSKGRKENERKGRRKEKEEGME